VCVCVRARGADKFAGANFFCSLFCSLYCVSMCVLCRWSRYLSTSREWLPRLLEETMAVGCEIGTRLATGMTGGSPESAVIAEEVKRNVATMRPKIQAVTLQILEAVDATAFADAALVRMDENGDGKVVREEFMRKFLAVMNDMFNPQQIIQSIQQAMGLLRE